MARIDPVFVFFNWPYLLNKILLFLHINQRLDANDCYNTSRFLNHFFRQQGNSQLQTNAPNLNNFQKWRKEAVTRDERNAQVSPAFSTYRTQHYVVTLLNVTSTRVEEQVPAILNDPALQLCRFYRQQFCFSGCLGPRRALDLPSNLIPT